MKPFNWNRDKSQQLQQQRRITFDDIIQAIVYQLYDLIEEEICIIEESVKR